MLCRRRDGFLPELRLNSALGSERSNISISPAFKVRGAGDFDGHDPIEPGVAGLPHAAKRADADLLQQLEVGKLSRLATGVGAAVSPTGLKLPPQAEQLTWPRSRSSGTPIGSWQ